MSDLNKMGLFSELLSSTPTSGLSAAVPVSKEEIKSRRAEERKERLEFATHEENLKKEISELLSEGKVVLRDNLLFIGNLSNGDFVAYSPNVKYIMIESTWEKCFEVHDFRPNPRLESWEQEPVRKAHRFQSDREWMVQAKASHSELLAAKSATIKYIALNNGLVNEELKWLGDSFPIKLTTKHPQSLEPEVLSKWIMKNFDSLLTTRGKQALAGGGGAPIGELSLILRDDYDYRNMSAAEWYDCMHDELISLHALKGYMTPARMVLLSGRELTLEKEYGTLAIDYMMSWVREYSTDLRAKILEKLPMLGDRTIKEIADKDFHTMAEICIQIIEEHYRTR